MTNHRIPDISDTTYTASTIDHIVPPHLKERIAIKDIDLKHLHALFAARKGQKESIPHGEKTKLVQAIVNFMKHGGYLRGKTSDLDAYEHLATRIGNSISSQRDPLDVEKWLKKNPIHIVLPAFANKSFNPLKTIRKLPDFWEMWSLLQLDNLCSDFSEVYGWPVRMTIVMDGTVYAPLFNEPMDIVIAYKETFMQLAKDIWCTHIDIVDMKDMLEWNAEFYDAYENNLRDITQTRDEKITRDLSLQNLLHNTAQNINTSMYTTHDLIQALVLEDENAPAKKKIYTQAALSAQKYHAFVSALYEQKIIYNAFPGSIRATCHPKPGQRGIHLIDKDSYNYPYNGVPFWTGTKVKIINQVDVDSNPSIIPVYIQWEDTPYFYTTKETDSKGIYTPLSHENYS